MDGRIVVALCLALASVSWPVEAGTLISHHFLRAGGTQPAGQVPLGVVPGHYAVFGFVREPAYAEGETRTVFEVSDPTIGRGIAFKVSEGAYDTARGMPTRIADLEPGYSPLQFEASPANAGNGTEQGNARSAAWGFDTEGGSTNRNAALVFDLRGSPDPIHFFSFDALDLEGGNKSSAYAAIFDTLGTLINTVQLDFGIAENYGNNTLRQFDFRSDPSSPLALVALIVGNDDGGMGYSERLAAANFAVGTQPLTPVPLPATLPLLSAGLAALLALRGRGRTTAHRLPLSTHRH